MRFTKFAAILALPLATTMLAAPAAADRKLASAYVPDARLTGEASLKMLGFEIFDAELFAPAGHYSPTKPYALTLEYRRDFSAKSIVDRTVKELGKQGRSTDQQLASWKADMERIFPDVNEGTRITGIRDKDGNARFFRDGQEIGMIADPAFSDRFFAIWLGDQASNTAFRRQLTGAAR